MKLGIVGPLEIVLKIEEIIKLEFKDIIYEKMVYNVYTETSDMIKRKQNLDAILFAGYVPYEYAKSFSTPSISWESVPRHGGCITRVLLLAALAGYNILNLSFDSYSNYFLYEAYNEIGIPSDKLNVILADDRPLDKHYLDYIYLFHKENYNTKRVGCCITGVLSVYKKLLNDKIPCFCLYPTKNIIRETIAKLQLKYLLQISSQSQIVAICISIDLPNEFSVLYDNDYQFSLSTIKVLEHIYIFAEKIQAAVVDLNQGYYLLFCTKKIIEMETDNYQRIELIDSIYSNTISTISMGIGYGITAKEAKNNALYGSSVANMQGGNRAYLVYENKKLAGPIVGVKNFKDIAEKTCGDSHHKTCGTLHY